MGEMTAVFKAFVEAMKLSAAERADLAILLLDSITPADLPPELEESLIEQLELMKRGELKTFPAEEVLARLRAKDLTRPSSK